MTPEQSGMIQNLTNPETSVGIIRTAFGMSVDVTPEAWNDLRAAVAALLARCEQAEDERDAALAKLVAVGEAWKWVKHDGSPHADDINAALASTPEIVAVVDGSIMTASGGSTHWHEFRAAVDLPHGDYRAIIVNGRVLIEVLGEGE